MLVWWHNITRRHWYSLETVHGLQKLISKTTHLLPNSLSRIHLIFTYQPSLVVDSGVHASFHPNCHHYEFTGRWSATSLNIWVLLQVFFAYSAEANYLRGFYVDQYSGDNGLIVTWRQILKCDMIRESFHADMRSCVHVVVPMRFCIRAWKILIAC